MAICSVQSIAYTWQHGQIRMLVKAQIFPVLQDERIAAVEHALGFLGSYTELGGSFLARRFRQEAWPQLQRLLQRGPSSPACSCDLSTQVCSLSATPSRAGCQSASVI